MLTSINDPKHTFNGCQPGDQPGNWIYKHCSLLPNALKHGIYSRRFNDLLSDLTAPTGAYLYSQLIDMPELPDTDFLIFTQ